MDYDRFYENDDEYKDSYTDGYDEMEMEDSNEVVGYLNSEEIISVINADIAQKEMRITLLEKAMIVASQSWFWRFRSEDYKTDCIASIFFQLQELTNIE